MLYAILLEANFKYLINSKNNMSKKEKFEKLQYETYKSIYLTFVALMIVVIIANTQVSEDYKFILSIFIILFSLASILSFGLFFKFYKKLRNRYS